MNELMVHVERAVRPVRAGGARKLKMREELLAHITTIYEEERARLGNDAEAVREACRRFGESAELTKELQDTVPRYERFLATPMPGSDWSWRTLRWFRQGPDEGAVRHAARLAAGFAGCVLAFLCLGFVIRVEAATAAVLTAHAFVTAMLCLGFYRATSGPLTGRAVLVAAACGVPLAAGGPALLAALAAVNPDNARMWSNLPHADELGRRMALAGLFGLVSTAVVFRVAFARQRRILEWMELKLDG